MKNEKRERLNDLLNQVSKEDALSGWDPDDPIFVIDRRGGGAPKLSCRNAAAVKLVFGTNALESLLNQLDKRAA